jgi:hypothetical protein
MLCVRDFSGTSREYENGEESSVREESLFLVQEVVLGGPINLGFGGRHKMVRTVGL